MTGPVTGGFSPSCSLAAHFVYQRIHTLAGKPLHFAEHLDIAARAFDHIYGARPALDEAKIAAEISAKLRAAHYTPKGSATMLFCLAPDGPNNDKPQITITPERQLLDTGYTHSSLRPMAITYEYSIPFSSFPTGFQLSATSLFDTIATIHSTTDTAKGGSARSIRREGKVLVSCGDAPLFGIRGRTIFTASLLDGAIDSVERNLVIASASDYLSLREEPVLHSELTSFDELFFADAAGITSLSECDGAKFMSLLAPRLVDTLSL